MKFIGDLNHLYLPVASTDADRVLTNARRGVLMYDKTKLTAEALDIDENIVSGGSRAVVVTGFSQ